MVGIATGLTAERMQRLIDDQIALGAVNLDGRLIFTRNNGTTVDAGLVRGADGKDGKNGTNGTNGVDGKDGATGPSGTVQIPAKSSEDYATSYPMGSSYFGATNDSSWPVNLFTVFTVRAQALRTLQFVVDKSTGTLFTRSEATTTSWTPFKRSDSYETESTLVPVVRLQSGTSYPTRVAGRVNIFVGSLDPAGLMSTGDIWAGSDFTTIPKISAELSNPASALYSAARTAMTPTRIFKNASELGIVDNRPATLGSFSSTANSSSSLPAWFFPDGQVSVVGGLFLIPPGWQKVRCTIWWSQQAASPSGAVRWLVRAYPLDTVSSVIGGGSSISVTSTAPQQNILRSHLIPDVADVPVTGGLLRVNVARVGADGADSFSGVAGLVGLEIERTG